MSSFKICIIYYLNMHKEQLSAKTFKKNNGMISEILEYAYFDN